MHPIPRRCLPALLLPLLAFPRPACADPAFADPALADPALADRALTPDLILARLAAAPARRATFRERRRFAALDTTLDSTGHLAIGPGYLEKTTDWPQPERLQVEGDRVIVTAGNEAPRVIELGYAPELRTLIDAIRGPLSGDAAAIHRAFDASATGTLAGWTLDLVPREAAARRMLRTVRLQGHGATVDRLAVTQANGDEQAMTITPQ